MNLLTTTTRHLLSKDTLKQQQNPTGAVKKNTSKRKQSQ